MEAACSSSLPPSTGIGLVRTAGRSKDFVRSSQLFRRDYDARMLRCSNLLLKWGFSRGSVLVLSGSCKDSRAPIRESGNYYPSFDGSWSLLKSKAQEVTPALNGRCLFLVGMMGSGKTTVGKVLSEALGYSYVDSDAYVEETVGGSSVAQIFNQCGESFFRDCESEALRKLSLMPQQLVATGGGAVVRPINWNYMRQGITVFLDVPLDALARRIAAVGTDSRPLLHFESGDPYTKAFMGLFALSKKRAGDYASADVTVSLTRLAAKLGVEDVADIRPATIAIEVIVEIQEYVKERNANLFC